jgi:hypothetical protein
MANPNSEATLGYQSYLAFETNASSGVYLQVEECKDMPEFGDEYQEVDVTNQQSPGRRVEFIAGFAQGQEFTVECNWIKGTVQELVRAAQGTTRNFRMIYSTTPSTTFTFGAVIKSAKVTGPVQEAKKLMITLRVTGTVTES